MELEKLLTTTQSGYQAMIAGDFGLPNVYGLGEEVAKNVRMSPSFDLHDLIKHNGGTVHYVDHAAFRRFEKYDVFENSIYVHDEKDFDIILPLHVPMAENRYTMAHELGHYALHSKGQCFAKRKGTDLVEQEADCFALGFLMPTNIFKPMYEQCNKNPYELSIAFLLPIESIKRRIQSLELA